MWDTRGDVIIIGGGIAGLSCALHLLGKGLSPLVLEAASEVGGRMRTDVVDGFLVDHGLHFFLTGDPEARYSFHLPALELRPLAAGARIRFGGRYHRVVDPFRDPARSRRAFLSSIGTFADKLRMVALRARLLESSLPEIFSRPRTTTLALLRDLGFSAAAIERFFRPFFATFFHERDLESSSHLFELITRMLALGDAALPAHGIGSIPRHLAHRLPEGALRTGARVERILPRAVRLEGGEMIRADAIVVAASAPDAGTLTGQFLSAGSCSSIMFAFAAPEPPYRKPVYLLNGDGSGPVNGVCVPSQIAPSYAPRGQALVVATVIGARLGNDRVLERAVRSQLGTWFGPAVTAWRLLSLRRIIHAVPWQPPVAADSRPPAQLRPGLFVCGDHCEVGLVHGALRSGRRAAEEVVAELSGVAMEDSSG